MDLLDKKQCQKNAFISTSMPRPPIAPEVAAAINQRLAEPFGNPSGGHWAALPARQAVEKARTQVAEVVFTSGGSEP